MKTCPACALVSPPEARFCSRCAQPLVTSPDLEGDRRVVTVLFADLCGFTSLCERLDPEGVAELVNLCLTALSAPVYRHGGTVDKFIGDAVMALFGAPRAHGDDPDRALAAALEMQTAMESLTDLVAERYGARVRVRIGLNTGLVVAGWVGDGRRRDFTVVGDAVNLAQRMEATAEPGAICVTEATARLASPRFDLAFRSSIQVKGRTAPVRVYQLRGRREADPEPILRDLVGRKGALAHLEGVWSEARQGRPQVLALVGSAGVGKSTLVCHWRKGLSSEVRWIPLEAGDVEGDVLAPLLRAWLGVKPGEAPDVLRERLVLRAPGVEVSHRELLLSAAGVTLTTMPCPELDDAQRQALAGLLAARLVAESARETPMVLALEEFDGSDRGALAWLGVLAENLRESGSRAMILLIGRERPEHALARLHGDCFMLSPLDDDEARCLAQHLAEGMLSESEIEGLVVRAEGNPTVLRELIGAARGGDPWPSGLTPPLTALVTAQLDRLDPRERLALEAAAVLGRTFDETAIAALVGHAPGEVLRLLERRGLMREGDEGAWRFQHGLVREVAYDGLLLRRRRELHRLAAAHLGATSPDADWLSKERAEHHLKAGDPAGALPLLIRAARLARRMNAPEEARRLFEQARETAGSLDHPAPELGIELAEVQAVVGSYGEALAGFQVALDHARELAVRSLLHRRIGGVLERMGRFGEAHDAYEQALALVPTDQAALAAPLWLDLAWLDLRAGRVQACEAGCRRALDAFGVEGYEIERARAHSIRGVAALRAGRWETAAESHRLALALREAVGDWAGVAASFNNLGTVAADRGDLAAAEEHYARSAALYRRLGDRGHQATVLNNLGDLAARQGRLAEARAHHSEALAERESLGERFGVAASSCALGDVLRRMGESEPARLLLERGLRELEAMGATELLAETCESLGRLEAAAASPGVAERWFQRALRHALKSGDAARRAAIARAQARMALDLGDRAVARRRLAQADHCLSQAEHPAGRAEQEELEARLRHMEGGDSAADERPLGRPQADPRP